RLAELAGDLLRPHEELPPLRKGGLLAGLWREQFQLGNGIAKKIGLTACRLKRGAPERRLLLKALQIAVARRNVSSVGLQPPKSVEQQPMLLTTHQSAIVMLAVDLHEHPADIAEQPGAYGPVID